MKLTANSTPLIKRETHFQIFSVCCFFQFVFVSGGSRCSSVALCVAFGGLSRTSICHGDNRTQLKEIRCCDVSGRSPACCWLMLFLATSPFQRRLHCSGTAGGLPVCLSVCLSEPPHPPKTSSRPSSSLTPPAARANRPPRRSAVLQEVR